MFPLKRERQDEKAGEHCCYLPINQVCLVSKRLNGCGDYRNRDCSSSSKDFKKQKTEML